jgi:hypothetical protein
VKITPHKKRGKTAGGTSGGASDGVLRLATNPSQAQGRLCRMRRPM